MPARAYRASTKYMGAHITANLWLWIIVFAVATIALGFARWQVGGGDHLGDLMALAGTICGTLIMIKSQEGYVAPDIAGDEEVVVTPDIPRA